MKEKLDLVRFNLTNAMTRELIKFNELKKELLYLKNKKLLTNQDIVKIKETETKLNKTKIKFIKEFRENNKEEILKYLKIKDQIWSFFVFLKDF